MTVIMATRGDGGRALGRHLADADGNESVRVTGARGLMAPFTGAPARAIPDAIEELRTLGQSLRTRRPIRHVSLSPRPESAWTNAQWRRAWALYEKEFDLIAAPFVEIEHAKLGRVHRHRVYVARDSRGKVADVRHDFARHEKLARIIEVETGERLTKGRRNRAVAAALAGERPDVAAAMVAEGLTAGAKPAARMRPAEREQGARTGIDPRDVQDAAWAAWRASDSGPALVAALAGSGLALARGDKVPVLIDRAGGTHPLARAVGAGAKAATGSRVRAADVHGRIAGLVLPGVAVARLPSGVPLVVPAAARLREAEPSPDPSPGGSRPHRRQSLQPDAPGGVAPAQCCADRNNAGGSKIGRVRGPGSAENNRKERALDTATDSPPAVTVMTPRRDMPAGTDGTASGAPPPEASRDRDVDGHSHRVASRPEEQGHRAKALATVDRAIAAIAARVKRREGLRSAERDAAGMQAEAEGAIRSAERALSDHEDEAPRGLWAWITGRRRLWRREREALDRAVIAAYDRERDAAGILQRARRAVFADGTPSEAAWDAVRLKGLDSVRRAVGAGQRAVIEAAAGGDLDAAIAVVLRPPSPVPERAGTPLGQPESDDAPPSQPVPR